MSDPMSPMDRDCIIAAILTVSMKGQSERVGAGTVTERYANVLKELLSHGGTGVMWKQAYDATRKD